MFTLPTEPIGSIPRPLSLLDAIAASEATDPTLDPQYDEAIRDTIRRFEETRSPVMTDGEQRKYHNFWTYCLHGRLEAAEYLPIEQLGTTDDCGFSPFSDDRSTSRDTAFAKIAARVRGTALAAKILGK